MESLPIELVRYIYFYVPSSWLRLCNRQMAHKYFHKQKFQTLLSWYQLQQKIEYEQQKMYSHKKQLQTLQSSMNKFRNYKDVEKYNEHIENIKLDIEYRNSRICYFNKQKHSLLKRTNYSNHWLELRYKHLKKKK